MLRHPRFKPHLQIETVPEEGVFLLSEQTKTVLQGRLYELVARCLDGSPIAEVCNRLRGLALPAQVYYTVAQLEKKGYLTEGGDGLPHGEAALWSAQDIEPRLAAQRLSETAAAVRVVGDVDAGPFRSLLQELCVRLDDAGQLLVVLTDSYLRSGLEAINQESQTAGRPWLLVKPIGTQIWLGPLFRPGATGCWECLAARMRANSPVAGYIEKRRGHNGTAFLDPSQTPATQRVAWGLAATAVTSWLVRGELPELEGKVQTLNVLTMQVQSHSLVHQPTCPICGETPTRNDQVEPIVLQSCKKTFTKDGGHRAVSPEQTLERYAHLVSPITGAVSVLERAAPAGDSVMHVYVSGHNAARQPRNIRGLQSDLRSSSAGKGITDVQARAGALCEGLERYSAVFRGDEPLLRARMADLGEEAIHPNACMLFSDKQYREREKWNARGSPFDTVPVPFEPAQEIDWTPVWSLTRRAVRYLPTAFCYFDYPQPCGRAFCWSCSNGNAAGNTREEAILQGFLELVERDAVALWWYNRVRRPGVDLDSFQEPYLGELRDFLKRYHRQMWVLDLTSDLGIPVFMAATRRVDGAAEQILFGFGAHLDARLALLRAVTEMNQMVGHLLDAHADEAPGGDLTDTQTVEWLRTATLDNQPYMVPLEGGPQTLNSFPACQRDNLTDDILACQALVERLGMEMLVLDQTRSEIGMPVVKVIVPGLRHFWARFAPGRLYDVPVRLGWLPQPLTEDQLNPAPMIL
jgi:oxazoline/thiazoline synthase